MSKVIAGIDVGAKSLHLAMPGTLTECANTPAGRRQLVEAMRKRGVQRVVLEASGIYSLEVALAIHDAAIPVMIANPRASKHFAEAMMSRGKTDASDAELLLEFAARMPFEAWQPPPREAFELRAISRRLFALGNQLRAEKSRLHASNQVEELGAVVRADVELMVEFLQHRIQTLVDQALSLVRSSSTLSAKLELLQSVTGIAQKSGVLLLGELAVLPPGMSQRQWVAHAGLDPRPFESGTSVQRAANISKRGNRYLRAALYMPALVAIRHSEPVRSFYRRLIERNKAPMQANVAVMRKLLHAIHGMFRTDTMFDEQRFLGAAVA